MFSKQVFISQRIFVDLFMTSIFATLSSKKCPLKSASIREVDARGDWPSPLLIHKLNLTDLDIPVLYGPSPWALDCILTTASTGR